MDDLGEMPFQTSYQCSQCDSRHSIAGTAILERHPLVLGGPDSSPGSAVWTMALTCPNTGKKAQEGLRLDVGPGNFITSIQNTTILTETIAATQTSHVAETSSQPEAEERNWLVADFEERLKKSQDTLREYSKTMLATSTGGVAVYFVVLKYLGLERVGNAWDSFTIIPAVLLFFSATMYAWAMHPKTVNLNNINDYAEFRKKSVNASNKRARAGSVLLLAAVALSILIFGVLLWQ